MRTLTMTSLSVTLYILTQSITSAAPIEDNWQQRRLLAPSAGELVAEYRGRVTIYDGLHEELVDRALDTQFDRVERMMFVRVKHNTSDGGIQQEEDCD